MKTIPDYCKATNMAYEVLERSTNYSIPVPIFSIIREYSNIRLYSYSEIAQRKGISFDSFCEIAPSYYGYSIRKKRSARTLIFYNDNLSYEIIRFTLAHELGHYILNHFCSGNEEDKEANCFARNLLCPLPVVDGLGISKPREYSEAFYVSEPMGLVAIQYRESDNYYITKNNYSLINDRAYCFFTGMTLAELYGVSNYY